MSLTEKDFRGRLLILAFYPADWSPVCGDQLALYAAEAAVSVRSQVGEEAFWAMHDAIFIAG